MSTGKRDLYKWPEDHEFPHFLLSYTEDQAGQYIRPEDELRARNGYWFTDEEADQFRFNNTMGTVTYGTCEECMESGPVQQACTTCMRPSCCGYVIMYIRESEGQTRFIDSVGLSEIFGTMTNKAMADRRAKWTNNRSKRLTRQDMKVKIALHYLNKNIGDQDYGTLVEERTKFAEEKLFGDS